MKPTLPTDTFNVAVLKQTANGDSQFFNMMIENFTMNAKALVEVFESGLSQKDWIEIGEKAHKAIPSFKFFKFNAISSSLAEIEDLALRKKKYEYLPDIISKTKTAILAIIKQSEAAKIVDSENE
ncbi:hypothetical protein GM418_29640 [Maribellus comscasis]|uniref:HPt domain-containing protein n=1 Tax=Maribellus comscasis TaxID=2681766 RepID=A0A6I6K1Z4_9BACT|nr:hypothetical protein [Maribellus comscasis]QGY47679.1 hypothetical protein GM418_29640 [Maribellus comscasis]